MRKNILALGALNLDVIAGYCEQDAGLPMASWGKDEEREIGDREWWHLFYSYLSGRQIRMGPGGSAANMGAALAALDPELDVRVAGVTGDDAEADHLRSPEHWYGAATEFAVVYGERTGRALSYVGFPGQGRRIAVSPGVNDHFTSAAVPDSLISDLDWLHVSSFVSERANGELCEVLRRAQDCSPGVQISIDPGTFLTQSPLLPTAGDCLRHCDYLLTKTSELLRISGVSGSGTEEGIRRLAVAKVFAVAGERLKIVVERIPDGYSVYQSGAHGCESVGFGDTAFHEVIDDTGAGDVFDAAFVYGTLRGLPARHASNLVRSALRSHLRAYGREGYRDFASCAPILFASHSTRDKPYVEQFVRLFQNDDVTFWIDVNELPLGRSLTREIDAGIRACDALLLFLTPDSVASGWVAKEFDWARSHGIRIIPIVLAACDVPPDLRDVLHLDILRDGAASTRDRFVREFARRNAAT
jgi:sugar/nucleoside kinase (ribokinase family)